MMNLKTIAFASITILLTLATQACKPEYEEISSFVQATSGNGDLIKLGLKANDPDKELYDLIVAGPFESEGVGLCPVSASQSACQPGGNNFYGSKLIYATKTKKFFLINNAIKLENDFTVRLVSLASGGTQLGSRDIRFSWTGGGKGPGDATTSSSASGQQASGQQASGQQASGQQASGQQASGQQASGQQANSGTNNAQLVAVVRRACDGCHHSYAIEGIEVMKTDGSLSRMQSGNMPKASRPISNADRQAIMTYLQN